jgi:hypothetical protein
MEVLVALLIIATSLLLLLITIRQGLIRLESCRSEFQSCLSMQTAVSAFSCGIDLPSEESNWTADESELRPGLKVVRLQPGNGKGAIALWVSKISLEEPAGEGPAEKTKE